MDQVQDDEAIVTAMLYELREECGQIFEVTETEFLVDCCTGDVFRVDEDTAVLNEEDTYTYFELADIGDRAEIEQFVQHDIFSPQRVADLGTNW